MIHVGVVGLGATGAHIVRHLRASHPEGLWLFDPAPGRAQALMDALGSAAMHHGDQYGGSASVVVLAGPGGTHAEAAAVLVEHGRHVVSVSNHPGEVAALLELDGAARDRGVSVAVGAGFVPGMSCLLVRHAAGLLDEVTGVAVAQTGTGGPACARERHRALKEAGQEFHDGLSVVRAGGSGRELAWFPEPIGARDCYRGDLASPFLLHRVFPDAQRLTARMSATRRDRLTSRLPMLRPPHDDGGPGGLRVEVRGRRGVGVETVVYGVADHPSVAAGAVAATVAVEVASGRTPAGAFGLAELTTTTALLRALRERGIRTWTAEDHAPL